MFSDDFFSSGSEDDLSDLDNEDSAEFDYDPDGVESNEDSIGCCQWKTTSHEASDPIEPSPNLSEYGKPSVTFDENIQQNELVETILDDDFIDVCIECTNAHGIDDIIYMKEIGSFIRGFLAIK